MAPKIHPSQTWQGHWKPPRPVHANPCLVKGCDDKEALQKAFATFGEVKDIFVPSGCKFAVVRFADDHDATKAVKALNGKDIGGAIVEVKDGKAMDKDLKTWRESLITASSIKA